jgi:hypothetical protein
MMRFLRLPKIMPGKICIDLHVLGLEAGSRLHVNGKNYEALRRISKCSPKSKPNRWPHRGHTAGADSENRWGLNQALFRHNGNGAPADDRRRALAVA